jgi:transient receptor potential cation channel subfamily M member 2
MSKIQPRLSKIRRDNVFHLEPKSFDEEISLSEKSIDSLRINKARCCCIVLDKEGKSCCCGLPAKQHNEDVIRTKHTLNTWSLDTCVEEYGLTDAYGDVEFVDNGDNIAKYIRVHYKTKMNKMLKVLFDCWKLNEPKLLISVTGGAQKFNLNSKLQECFRKGLVKAAGSTDAWISTGGLNVGVMKHVGEAVGENPNDKIVVLGIATWTMVFDNNKLINYGPNQDEVAHYSLSRSIPPGIKKQFLDPNHTHFVLVDNAKHTYGGEIEFRAHLESAIANRNPKESIPIVQLVLEGGPGTLDTVANAIKEKVPCVFVDGSGKCADLFAFALKYIQERGKNSRRERIDENLKRKLFEEIRNIWKDKNHQELLDTMIAILDESNDHLLSVFDINKSDDIDIAILTSLLKAKKENYKSQLKLALKWNRVDIARDYIFKENIVIDVETMNEIMYEALVNDRVEFVRLILEHGFNLKCFLTWRRLLKLYNDMLPSSRLFSSFLVKIHKEKNLFDFKDIGKAIEKLVNYLYKSQFTHVDFSYIMVQDTLENTDEFGKAKDGVIQREYSVIGPHCGIDINEKCDVPDHELFILLILNTKAEMAKIFWERGHVSILNKILFI